MLPLGLNFTSVDMRMNYFSHKLPGLMEVYESLPVRSGGPFGWVGLAHLHEAIPQLSKGQIKRRLDMLVELGKAEITDSFAGRDSSVHINIWRRMERTE